jgi:uncharacterized cupin superfamily protein
MFTRIDEAPLRRGEGEGLAPDGDGWFVVNVAEARALHTESFGDGCRFEGESRFPEFGINVRLLQPGQPASLYHREDAQEAFLVLSGECLAIVEEQERWLRAGDFVHMPAGTAHVFVGAGDGPCLILMAGARKPQREFLYPVSRLAARYGASVKRETASPEEAYGGSRGSWSKPEYTTLGPVL